MERIDETRKRGEQFRKKRLRIRRAVGPQRPSGTFDRIFVRRRGQRETNSSSVCKACRRPGTPAGCQREMRTEMSLIAGHWRRTINSAEKVQVKLLKKDKGKEILTSLTKGSPMTGSWVEKKRGKRTWQERIRLGSGRGERGLTNNSKRVQN